MTNLIRVKVIFYALIYLFLCDIFSSEQQKQQNSQENNNNLQLLVDFETKAKEYIQNITKKTEEEQKKFQKLNEEITAFLEKHKELIKQNETLKKQMLGIENNIKSNQDSINLSKSDGQGSLTSVKKQLGFSENESIENIKQSFESLKNEVMEINKQNATLKQKQNELENLKKKNEEEIAKLNLQKESLERDKTDKNKEIENLTNKIKEKEVQLAKTKEELQLSEKSFQQTEATIGTKTKTIQETETSIQKIKEQIVSIEKEIEKIEKEKQEIETSITNLNNNNPDISKIEVVIKEYLTEENLKNYKEKYNEQINQIKIDITKQLQLIEDSTQKYIADTDNIFSASNNNYENNINNIIKKIKAIEISQ
jgi:chromosome segregation ATPase